MKPILDLEDSRIDETDSFGSSHSFDLHSGTGDSKATLERKGGDGKEHGL